ncbi:MAG: hypothetical protein ABSH35_21795 [Isosphaeraceae bacterium]
MGRHSGQEVLPAWFCWQGRGVQGGIHGKVPSLTDLPDGDPKWSVDFRRIYATVLEDWLGLSAEPSLGGRFERLPLIH